MRKFYSFWGVLGIIGIVMSACGPSEAEKETDRKKRKYIENPIHWNTYSLTTKIPFERDTLHVNYNINISYLYPQEYQNELIKSELNHILNSTLWGEIETTIDGKYPTTEAYVTNYVRDQEKLYLEQLKEQIPIWNGLNGDSLFTDNQEIETQILYNEANFVSYQVIVKNYRGDSIVSSPHVEVTNLTIDLVEGKLLKEEDLFKVNYKEKLNELLVNQMQEYIKIKNVDTINYWGVYDISSNNNFSLSRDYLCYTFGPQEYANQSEGVITLCLKYEDIKDLFKENSLLNFFLDAEKK